MWLDVSAGVAGDMLLGALVDAGASLAVAQAAVDAVIPGTVRLVTHETEPGRHARPQGRGRAARAGPAPPALVGDPGPAARRRPRRHGAPVVACSLRAVGGGRGHGCTASVFDDVHFHEVGAWDFIADVVGSCAALVDLGARTVTAGRLSLGSGSVRAAHGRVPVPVPAVLELRRGWHVTAGGDGELVTLNGAALVTAGAQRQSDCRP